MATKITNKEMNERLNKVEARMDAIDSKLDSLLEAINGKPSGGRNSDGQNKDIFEGQLVGSRKGVTLKITVENGKGKGEGKKFIKISFSDKPTQNAIDTMKLNGFKYFHIDHTWSTYHTDKKMKVAQSLIK